MQAQEGSVVDDLPFSESKKQYIVDVLDPVLEEMLADVVTELPSSPLDFMIEWLQKRSGMKMSMRVSVMAKNAKLKQELKHVTESLHDAVTGTKEDEEGLDDVEDEEEEEDDDCGDELPDSFKKSEASMAKVRTSVSAEAYGNWNQKKEFVAPTYHKTPEQKDRLKTTLLKSFMFASLEPKDLEVVVLAMKEVLLSRSERVINEGEDGDFLFVIEKGTLDCMKRDPATGSEKAVKTCLTGDVFGELALLYNCPRAASVVAKEDCVCWQLDRETFNNVVKDAAVKKRDKYDAFLKSVTLIAPLGAYERSQIADALKQEVFRRGETIVKQDEPGDKFYILEEGNLYAVKTDDEGFEKRVMDYSAGDYFGELALLQNQPRAASVLVQSETAKVLAMSRIAFSKMLGPLQHILAGRVATYTK